MLIISICVFHRVIIFIEILRIPQNYVSQVCFKACFLLKIGCIALIFMSRNTKEFKYIMNYGQCFFKLQFQIFLCPKVCLYQWKQLEVHFQLHNFKQLNIIVLFNAWTVYLRFGKPLKSNRLHRLLMDVHCQKFQFMDRWVGLTSDQSYAVGYHRRSGTHP